MRSRPTTKSLRKSAALALCVGVVLASVPARANVENDVSISVLTFGPGDHPFTKFGHTALVVESGPGQPALVYNWGTFAFDSFWLFPRFLQGTYRYWLAVQPLGPTLHAYADERRWVVAQRLRLTPTETRTILNALAVGVREENRYYDYDYYRDNCVTRVRDLIDHVTGGSLSKISKVPGEATWRQHTSRATRDSSVLHFLLNTTLTSPTDQPIQAWEEMFLPAKFYEWLGRATVQQEGVSLPLVETETVLVDDNSRGSRPSPAARAPVTRPSPPSLAGPLIPGACVGALLGLLGYWASLGSRVGNVCLAVATSILGLAAGSLGLLFVFLWAATRHSFAYHNENLLQLSPLALALPVLAVIAAAGGQRAAHWAWVLTATCLGGSIAGLLLKAVPALTQQNLMVIALALPIWLGATAAWWRRAHAKCAQRAERDLAGEIGQLPTSRSASLEKHGNQDA